MKNVQLGEYASTEQVKFNTKFIAEKHCHNKLQSN